MRERIEGSYWALRLVFGVVPMVAGLDKFTNLLADWQGYLSPLALRVLPVSPGTFMALVGIVEIGVGAAVLAGYARIFGWVAAGWLLAISANLLAGGRFLDVAARDVALAVCAAALARLAPLHEREERRSSAPAEARAHA
jgi:uncharacterized membrane protein YphA (DoxX/SURF4 family)